MCGRSGVRELRAEKGRGKEGTGGEDNDVDD